MSIVLKQSDKTIFRNFKKEFVPLVNDFFSFKAGKIRPVVQEILRDFITLQPEWRSLVAKRGVLRQHFGLPDSEVRAGDILDQWLNSVKVDLKPMNIKGDKFTGGITITAIQSDFQNVLNNFSARFLTEKGSTLEWLRWLLLEGNKKIVKGYFIGRGRGRAGNRIMIKSKRSSWHVPLQFAGRRRDNFVTRAVNQAELFLIKEIESIMNE